MKRLAISIEYQGKTYISDYNEVSEGDAEKHEEGIRLVMQGKAHSLDLTCNNKKMFFPKQILMNSIISLVFD